MSAASNPVRIGIIGLGFMGRMHISAYEKVAGARIVAIADQDALETWGRPRMKPTKTGTPTPLAEALWCGPRRTRQPHLSA